MSKGMPLISWDFYMEGYHKLMQKGDDLQQLRTMAKKQSWQRSDWNIEEQLLRKKKVIVVTDASFTIQFATSNLAEMNGYHPREVIGRSPKIFQGPLTEDNAKQFIREALQKQVSFTTVIINYRKDGTLYHCEIEEHPVWNKQGKLVNFIAFENIAA